LIEVETCQAGNQNERRLRLYVSTCGAKVTKILDGEKAPDIPVEQV
jgi:hypothetical protein